MYASKYLANLFLLILEYVGRATGHIIILTFSSVCLSRRTPNNPTTTPSQILQLLQPRPSSQKSIKIFVALSPANLTLPPPIQKIYCC